MWTKIISWLTSTWKLWLIPSIALLGILVWRVITNRIPGLVSTSKPPQLEPHLEITHKQADKEKSVVVEHAQDERAKILSESETQKQAIDAAIINRDRRHPL
jgi:hypothetical protein